MRGIETQLIVLNFVKNPGHKIKGKHILNVS